MGRERTRKDSERSSKRQDKNLDDEERPSPPPMSPPLPFLTSFSEMSLLKTRKEEIRTVKEMDVEDEDEEMDSIPPVAPPLPLEFQIDNFADVTKKTAKSPSIKKKTPESKPNRIARYGGDKLGEIKSRESLIDYINEKKYEWAKDGRVMTESGREFMQNKLNYIETRTGRRNCFTTLCATMIGRGIQLATRCEADIAIFIKPKSEDRIPAAMFHTQPTAEKAIEETVMKTFVLKDTEKNQQDQSYASYRITKDLFPHLNIQSKSFQNKFGRNMPSVLPKAMTASSQVAQTKSKSKSIDKENSSPSAKNTHKSPPNLSSNNHTLPEQNFPSWNEMLDEISKSETKTDAARQLLKQKLEEIHSNSSHYDYGEQIRLMYETGLKAYEGSAKTAELLYMSKQKQQQQQNDDIMVTEGGYSSSFHIPFNSDGQGHSLRNKNKSSSIKKPHTFHTIHVIPGEDEDGKLQIVDKKTVMETGSIFSGIPSSSSIAPELLGDGLFSDSMLEHSDMLSSEQSDQMRYSEKKKYEFVYYDPSSSMTVSMPRMKQERKNMVKAKKNFKKYEQKIETETDTYYHQQQQQSYNLCQNSILYGDDSMSGLFSIDDDLIMQSLNMDGFAELAMNDASEMDRNDPNFHLSGLNHSQTDLYSPSPSSSQNILRAIKGIKQEVEDSDYRNFLSHSSPVAIKTEPNR